MPCRRFQLSDPPVFAGICASMVHSGSLPPLAAELRQLRKLLPEAGALDPPGRLTERSCRVQVFCRLRGQSGNEQHRGGEDAWELARSHVTSRDGGRYNFDRVFGPEASQVDLYDAVSPVLQDVLAGGNAAVLCYGQTSAGKTYTMEGANQGEFRGIIPRALEMLLGAAGSTVSFRMSVLEIYNERLQDLLDPRSEAELRIVDDRTRGISEVAGLCEVPLQSCRQALELLKRAQAHRATAATAMNDASSRSHSIFVLKAVNAQGERTGKLCLVDLAGSECVKKAYLQGYNVAAANAEILEEAKSINQSLSTLGLVISKLGSSKRSACKGDKHIPYRSSKLTRALQDTLGGNSRTVLVINCSISSVQIPETLSTLRFGSRARSIVNFVTAGSAASSSSRLLLTLRAARQEIERLRCSASVDGVDGALLSKPTLQALMLCSEPENEDSLSALNLSPRSKLSQDQAQRLSLGSQLELLRSRSESLLDLDDLTLNSEESERLYSSRRMSKRSRRSSGASIELSKDLLALESQGVLNGCGCNEDDMSASYWDWPLSRREKSTRLRKLLQHQIGDAEALADVGAAEVRSLTEQIQDLEERLVAVMTENEWLASDRSGRLEYQESLSSSTEPTAGGEVIQGSETPDENVTNLLDAITKQPVHHSGRSRSIWLRLGGLLGAIGLWLLLPGHESKITSGTVTSHMLHDQRLISDVTLKPNEDLFW